jgi:phosphoglycerate kinase
LHIDYFYQRLLILTSWVPSSACSSKNIIKICRYLILIEMVHFVNFMDLPIKGKKILLRVDINSSIDKEKNEIRSDPRIQALIPVLEKLNETAVVIMAHQGRRGDDDFYMLKLHAERIQKYLPNRKVIYVDDIFGEKAISAIKALKPGEILVLENVRSWEQEDAKGMTIEKAEKTEMIQKLAPLFDYYVNDAFGAAHRLHVSLVGWPTIAAGPIVASELTMVNKLMKPQKPAVWLVGGAKADDKFKAVKYNLEIGAIDHALMCGLTAIMMLEAKGVDMGEENRKIIKEHLDALKPQILEVLNKFGDKIHFPEDMAIEENGQRKEIPISEVGKLNKPTGDIGSKTIEKYAEIIRKAKTVVANGPPGIFEKEHFKKGSFALVDAMVDAAEKNGAYAVIGGGEMGSVAKMSGKGKKIVVSTGGGALLEILSGKKLPLLEVLEKKAPKL